MTANAAQITFGERDEFQRKTVAEKTIQLLRSDIEVSPMVIDGGWGTGKTEFCYKLINLMREQDDHHLIYVDAFKADHTDEAFLTILAEVLKRVPNEGGREELIRKILPAVRFSLKTLAKGAVAHLLRQDADAMVEGFENEIRQATEKAIDASVETMLQDHVKAEESLETLRSTLKELAKQQPIIIFIDELDRCRPDFAIKMLEIIKHAFSVDGVQFVLVTNTQQLKASINHCYGKAIDAQRYLDKFLKFSFALPSTFNPGGHERISASVSHCRNLIEASQTLLEAQLNDEATFRFIKHIIQLNDLSLREVETLIRHLEIYQVLTGNNRLKGTILGYKLIRIWGVALFTLQPEVAKTIADGKSDAVLLGRLFSEEGVVNLDGQHPCPEDYQALLVALAEDCEINAEPFKPVEESIPHWQEHLAWLFEKRLPDAGGRRLKILSDAIEVMMLGS